MAEERLPVDNCDSSANKEELRDVLTFPSTFRG
jgi:hypothetical protein